MLQVILPRSTVFLEVACPAPAVDGHCDGDRCHLKRVRSCKGEGGVLS